MKTKYFMGEIQEPRFQEQTFPAQNYESIQQACDGAGRAEGEIKCSTGYCHAVQRV